MKKKEKKEKVDSVWKEVRYPICSVALTPEESKSALEELNLLYSLIEYFNNEVISQKYKSLSMLEIIEDLKLDQNSVVIDLGTFVGQQIEDLAEAGVEVHAFEPHPIFSKLLEEKFSRHENVTINSAAAGSVKGEFDLFYQRSSDDFNGGASLVIHKLDTHIDFFEKLEGGSEVSQKVQCIDIAEYISSLDRQIDVLKIDVEGFEYVILSHLIETGLIDRVNHIFFADHRDDFFAQEWFSIAIETIKMVTPVPEIVEKLFSRHTQHIEK